MGTIRPEQSVTTRLEAFARLATAVVIGIGAIVLLGWTLGFRPLIRLFPVAVVMNPMAALAFILAGISLRRRQNFRGNAPGLDWIGSGLAFLVGAIGTLKIADYIFNFDFQVEQFLFSGRVMATGFYPQSEIAPNTALGFLFCSVALLTMDLKLKPGVCPAQVFIVPVGLLSLLALIGYSYRMILLYRIGTAEPMSLETALAFFMFSLALLAARPNQGLMTIVTNPTVGGIVARRLLPTALLVPWSLGALLLLGEKLGYYERGFALSFFAVASILIFTGLIWWNSNLLLQGELGRDQVEKRATAQHACTRVLVECSSLNEAAPKILSGLCRNLDWAFGAFWVADKESGTMRLLESWSKEDEPLREFEEATRRLEPRKGALLPGRIWAEAGPIWLEDAANEEGLARREVARKADLHSALAVPVRAGQEIFGVLEFYQHETEPVDLPLVEMLSGVGSQIGLFIDRTRAEERLRQMSANLARSNTDLQQFASVASHDLFEPLRMVTSYLELLRGRAKSKLEPQELEFLAFALDGANRMGALINDLLAYSRLELRGRPFEPTDLTVVVRGALSNLKVAIEEAKATIVEGPLPQVLGDSIQLIQVFQNLIGNGLKFRGAEPPRIEISATRSDGQWLFSVHDNGIGINPKDFERIFVIFQRLHTRQQYSGTGMGLAITKKVIERHGGHIWVESQPGKGSNFLFTLPVLDQNSARPAPTEAAIPAR